MPFFKKAKQNSDDIYFWNITPFKVFLCDFSYTCTNKFFFLLKIQNDYMP